MIKAIVIDDEKPAINVLKRHIEKIPEMTLVGTSTNSILSLELIRKEEPDVVFLDIQMDGMDGIELARALGDSTKVVFCTAYGQYAVESYELNALDYLLKPIEFSRFSIAAQKVIDAISGKTTPVQEIPNDYIMVKEGERGRLQKIDIDDIIFAKAMSNYVVIHTATKKVWAYLQLKEMADRLPEATFIRVHRSYIIALKQIETVNIGEIKMLKSETLIPIGANYKEAFLEKIRDKLLPKR